MSRVHSRVLTRRQLGTGAVALLAGGSARAETFDADAVANASPLRSVVWSWTTAEQADELRHGSPLFTRVTNKDGERGYLHTVLQKQEGRAAELLRSKRFDKGRFGWWNPWATADGYLGERWGDRLLRIQLEPRAWLAVVRSSEPSARVLDLDNRPVSDAQLKAEPDRLAGAFFIHDELSGSERTWCDPSIGGWAVGYREVYLGDEALVRSWSQRTGQIDARLESAAGALEKLAGLELPGTNVCRWRAMVLRAWDNQPSTAPEFQYRRGLAFASEEYRDTPDNLRRLAKLLRERKGL